jgi:hypothetical protein
MRLFYFFSILLFIHLGCAKDTLCPDSVEGVLYLRSYVHGSYPVIELTSGKIVVPHNLERFVDLNIVDEEPIPVYFKYDIAPVYGIGPPRVEVSCFRLQ